MYKPTKRKKLTAVLIAFLMIVYMLSPGLTAAAASLSAPKVFDLVEITDFHGTLEDSSGNPVAGVLAKNIKDIKASNPDRTLIIGGGDLYQGSPISNVLQGVPVQKVMSSIGMEVTTLGNHEFDWGLDTIINNTMKDAKYSIICSNLYTKGTNNRVFEPYKIIEKDGIKIGIIGAVTPSTVTKVLAKYIDPYEIRDIASEINSLVPEVRSKGADVVLALMHEGDNLDGRTGPIFDIASKLVGVDAIFGGDSHSIVNTTANGMPVYVANNAGKGFIDSKMTVGTDGKVTFSGTYVDINTTNANGYKAPNPVLDPEVKAIVDAAKAEVGPTFDEVIGTSAIDLTRTQQDKPYGESYLGNWSTDVIRARANADVGIQNNGGLRIDIPYGNITVGTIYTLMPFDNELCVLSMTKAQVKVVLEQAFMDGGKGIQLSGLKIKYDSTKPSGSRVLDFTRADGTPIGDNETLKVATNDFMATGGDGFAGFKAVSYDNTHILIRDALIDDVRAKKTISTTLDGRIKNMAKYINVVATSDVHGNIYPWDYFANKLADLGLAKVSSYVDKLRRANPNNVMVVDNGDTIQGTPLVTYYNMIDTNAEYPMMKVMGTIGYDTWTLGNHEYNYGLATLIRIMNDAKKNNIHILSANTYQTDGSNFVEPYYMKDFTVNGKTIKVAIIGLTTKTISSWEDPAHYAGLKFNDLVDEAKKWVPIVRGKGADVVIVTAHSGEESASDTIPENQIKALATNVSGIDAIVAGHAHSLLNDLTLKNPDGKVVPVVEPGKNAQYVSQIDLAISSDGKFASVSTSNVKMDNTINADPNITENVGKPYQDATLQYVKTEIGTSTGEFTGADQTTKATAIMELINKVQKEAAGTQLSIAAPLSATARIPEGDITIQDIMSVYVYENFLYGVKMTGKQVKDWLEWSVRYYKQVSSPNDPIVKDPDLNVPDYNLDQLYGATYDVDLTQPAGSRIKNLKYNGKLVSDTDIFTVAINNYRYNGGGGFMKAAGISNTDPSLVVYDSAKALGDDGQVRNLMIKYIQDHKNISPTVTENWKLYTSPVQQQIEDTLPTTGSPVDMGVVVNLGGLAVSLGAFMFIKGRKDEEDKAA
jgi:5''-nucleotidase/2'',3''-cyclic phosphodiesterase and related esterases